MGREKERERERREKLRNKLNNREQLMVGGGGEGRVK